MGQQPPPKHPHPPHANHQIPQKVTRRERLDHAPRPVIPPHALFPAHAAALLIHAHDPQRQAIDDDRLRQRDDVHVPVELRAGGQRGVDAGEEDGGEEGGDECADEVVGKGCEEEFVDVQGEGGEGEGAC